MRGVRLGYTEGYRDVIRYEFSDRDGERLPGEAHLITVAPTRSGKGRDILIPALLEFAGSCIVIDPKGQLAAVTGPERARMGQRVIIINPFKILPGVLDAESPLHFGPLAAEDRSRVVFDAVYNPMAALDHLSDSFGVDCDNIADSIVTHEGAGGSEGHHWSDSARGLVAGIIGHLVANGLPTLRNLAHLRKIITTPSLLRQAAQDAQEEAAEGGDAFIAQSLARYCEADAANKSEIASIVSTANTQTRFIANRAIARSLTPASEDFRVNFRDLKRVPTTVYLVLPTRYLTTCGKWFRLVLASALDDLLREDEKDIPVLAVMDEFAQLGRLAVIENAMGLAAGYGLQLWPVLQDLTQLQEHYPKRWETFLSAAEIQMFFAPRENTTAEYVSKLAGESTVTLASSSSGKSVTPSKELFQGPSETTSHNTSTSQTQRRIYLPQEVRWLGGDRYLMFAERAGEVTEVFRKPYFAIEEYNGKDGVSALRGHALYCPDPYYQPKPKAEKSRSVKVPSFRLV